ncbi:MAG TPA: redoxin domain-containing protein [Pirellulales bacterium]|nr:redoxin domain-containing protein [Pirellulales bacterium]
MQSHIPTRWTFTSVLGGCGWLAIMALLTAGGCGQGAANLPQAAIRTQESPADDTAEAKPKASAKAHAKDADPAALLQQLAGTYQKAATYEDAGELYVEVETATGEKQHSQPMPFSVAFVRPDKVRVQSLQATIVADGQKLYATSDGLEDEVLEIACPKPLTMDNLFSDALLIQSARGQINTPIPQLELLLNDQAVQVLTDGSKLALLDDAELDGQPCTRVAAEGKNGTSVFWISNADHLLVKFEFPANELKAKFGVNRFSVWAEMKGARIGQDIKPEAFVFNVPARAKRLKKLMPPPPSPPSQLIGQKPDDFKFVTLKGEEVTRDSLNGKVVVLDLWATWCGWCFRGFPNLEKVYEQFKDNKDVTILAVNEDDPNISDEQVRASFEKAQLTIPIVRDSQKMADKVLHVEGLPTMVILGADGTVQDYHVGFDPNLEVTLSEKLKRLAAGENLAKEELENYEQQRKEYDAQLAAAAADGTDAGSGDESKPDAPSQDDGAKQPEANEATP